MKISIERGTLLKAVAQAQSVVERRNTIPILANVLIEADDGSVTLRATDLDIEVIDSVAATIERGGATTVSAVMLHEIVRKLPDGALVELEDDGASGRMTVRAGRSNFSLTTLPREDFPVMASPDYTTRFAAPAGVLRRLFEKTRFAISTEETRYYLNGVYMHLADGPEGRVLRCVATDGHRLAQVDAPIPEGADGMPGVIVPRKTVGELRKLPDGALVQLADDPAQGRLTVQAGRSNFSLATLPKEDFPIMASSEYSSNFSAPAKTLRRLFDKTKFAISTEETRYYLNGVYMHVADGEDGQALRCVATDGHRLARVDTPLPDGAQGMPGVIVPRKTVGELRKLLEDDDAEIAVSVSETKLRFATPEITLTSKVIDGSFPDYTRVIPTANTRRLELDASEFARAVDRVATVSSERSRAVKLSLDEDRLILSVNAPDSGAATEELAVAYNDDPLEIGFNAKYLLEIASQVDRENAVFLFNDSGDPTLMREGDDSSAVYVVMPMRV